MQQYNAASFTLELGGETGYFKVIADSCEVEIFGVLGVL